MLDLRCGSCGFSTEDETDYREHLEHFNHWAECETCPRTFATLQSCYQHMNSTKHWQQHWDCDICKRVYYSLKDFHLHEATYCHDCQRPFQNASNYQAHRRSRLHRGATLTCPFCRNAFVSASGLSHHLEKGSCPNAPDLNREKILKIIRDRDPNGHITKRLLTWTDEASQGTYEVTSQAFNGYHWECYLCHRQFQDSRALTSHLNSPVHAQKVYCCPNATCRREFVSLAALCNHLESESCAFMRFEQVQERVKGVFTSSRMISFH